MSDIVERLRTTQLTAGLRLDAAAEIERLREWNRLRAEDIITLGNEIERLREQDNAWMTTVRKQEEELVRLREQVTYWNGIACEDRAEVERLRECLQGIANAPEQEPDDADWRFRFLEATRAAQTAISSR